jgi:hypothetical protein
MHTIQNMHSSDPEDATGNTNQCGCLCTSVCMCARACSHAAGVVQAWCRRAGVQTSLQVILWCACLVTVSAPVLTGMSAVTTHSIPWVADQQRCHYIDICSRRPMRSGPLHSLGHTLSTGPRQHWTAATLHWITGDTHGWATAGCARCCNVIKYIKPATTAGRHLAHLVLMPEP